LQKEKDNWKIFRNNHFSHNIHEVVETEKCKVFRVEDSTGEGIMTLYWVFDGVYLMYNDFHMKGCLSELTSPDKLLCIDHCREGSIKHTAKNGTGYRMEAGDMRVDRRVHHAGYSAFPLCHYHGITIGFVIEEAQKSLQETMPVISIDLWELSEKFSQSDNPFVFHKDVAVEHIFSELYNVPSKIRMDYYRIKVMELLLYLSALELPRQKDEKPLFYSSQIEKVKSIHEFITSDLTRTYSAEELARRFHINLNALKTTFKGLFGSPLYTYMRMYRMNHAASVLLKYPDMKIIEIAALVGYDNPSKFSAAFRETMGMSPLQYRNNNQQRSE